jgi:hypothetical protein
LEGEGNVDRIWMKEVGGGGQPNGLEEKREWGRE